MKNNHTLPLIKHHQANDALVLDQNKVITATQLINLAQQLAKKLPTQKKAINLCQNRLAFLVTFCAVLIRNQTNILPPNRLPNALNRLFSETKEIYYITDDKTLELELPCFFIALKDLILAPNSAFNIPQIKAEHLACILYTSGSTGTPQPQAKTWQNLVDNAQAMAQHLEQPKPLNLVATVPPQHMFGLETSILLPLQQGYCIHNSQPFFPDDIKTALDACPEPKALISTPIHIQHCLDTDLNLKKLTFVLSATAPLALNTALTTEQQWQTPLFEIYGCSEVGAIAHRRLTQSEYWTLSPEISINDQIEPCLLTSSKLAITIKMPDRVRLTDLGQLVLLGRTASLVNIGGKRSSIEELNDYLQQVEGVMDGTYYLPLDNTRLSAFVVCKTKTKQQIIQALKGQIDPLFLPRSLYFIESLPRNEVGKITQKAMQALFLSHSK